jgi:hypothetical protein
MNKFLIIILVGISILLSCQQNNRHNLSSKDNNLNEVITKTTDPHFDTIIAQMINSEIVFVNNISSKILIWEDVINNFSPLSVDFDEYNIEQEGGEYYLVGDDLSSRVTAKIKLVLDSGNIYEYEYPGGTPLATSTGMTVTCSGCTGTGSGSAGECQPKQNEDGWYCTDCSQGTCVKSSTVKSGGVVSGSSM